MIPSGLIHFGSLPGAEVPDPLPRNVTLITCDVCHTPRGVVPLDLLQATQVSPLIPSNCDRLLMTEEMR